jgi:hypothetical protein
MIAAERADAAIEAAVRVFSVNHEHTKRLAAVLMSRSPGLGSAFSFTSVPEAALVQI